MSTQPPLERLKLRQRECLRLVGDGYQTKEIARHLGISAYGVDKHIIEARRILGAKTRGEAARLLREWEATEDRDTQVYSLGPQPMGLSETSDLPPTGPVEHHTDAGAADDVLAEEQDGYSVHEAVPTVLKLLPLRIPGRRSNDLSLIHLLIVFVLLVAAALVAAGSAVSLLSAFASVAGR